MAHNRLINRIKINNQFTGIDQNCNITASLPVDLINRLDGYRTTSLLVDHHDSFYVPLLNVSEQLEPFLFIQSRHTQTVSQALMECFNWPGLNFMKKQQLLPKKTSPSGGFVCYESVSPFCHEVRDTETALQNTLGRKMGREGPSKGRAPHTSTYRTTPYSAGTHTQRQLSGE